MEDSSKNIDDIIINSKNIGGVNSKNISNIAMHDISTNGNFNSDISDFELLRELKSLLAAIPHTGERIIDNHQNINLMGTTSESLLSTETNNVTSSITGSESTLLALLSRARAILIEKRWQKAPNFSCVKLSSSAPTTPSSADMVLYPDGAVFHRTEAHDYPRKFLEVNVYRSFDADQ